MLANIYRPNTFAAKEIIRRVFSIYFDEGGTLYLIERYLAMHARDVQGNRLFKPIIRMAVAAAIAGLFVFATSAAPKANVSVDTCPLRVVEGNRWFNPILRMAVAAAIAGLFVFATSAAPKANVSVDTRPLPQ